MNMTELLAIFEDFKAIFDKAVVTVAILIDANTTITTTGLRSNKTIARAISRAGLSDDVDLGVWVPTSAFTAAQLAVLRGKQATITHNGTAIVQRILTTREDALGGLVMLSIGEYDRVTM
jgi:hypothetical protein